MDAAMLGKAVCGRQPALAPLPLCRAHEGRSVAFRPRKSLKRQQNVRCWAAKDADELQLVSREGGDPCMPIDLHAMQGDRILPESTPIADTSYAL